MKAKVSSSSSPSLAAAAVAVVVVVVFASAVVEASIEGTCRDAAAADRRVDVRFCGRQFGAYHGAAELDTWGLAKTAALIGINLGEDAVYDLTHGGGGKLLPAPAPGTGRSKAEAAMDACVKAYDKVGLAFAEASDELGDRRYAAARQEMARVAALVQRCDGGLARAGVASPLPRYSADCQQMAIIAIAITNLIK